VWRLLGSGGCSSVCSEQVVLSRLTCLHSPPPPAHSHHRYHHHHSTLPLIPTRAGSLAPPTKLFDPQSGDLAALFDDSHFPAAPCDSGSLLAALAPLGLRRGVDLQVLYEAADAIATAGEAAGGAAPRAHSLLRRLDGWAERSKSRAVSEQDEGVWVALQHVAWCPVLVGPPEAGLPWPHRQPEAPAASGLITDQPSSPARAGAAAADTHTTGSSAAATSSSSSSSDGALILAPPRMVRPVEDAWIASAPARLCAGRAGGPLIRLLGWADPLSPQLALAQLVELARAYPAAAEWPAAAPAAADKVGAAAGRLYTLLAAALRDPLQKESVELALKAAPVVWVGTGFTDGDAAALSPRDASVPGLLFVVPPEMAEAHAEVLRLAGVGERWGFEGYALALSVLAEKAGGRVLDDLELGTALHLAECAAQTSGGAVRSVGAAAAGAQQGSSEVMLPDTSCIMAPSVQLHFNDAAWLESQGVRLVHEGLSHAAAEALGVRSMR